MHYTQDQWQMFYDKELDAEQLDLMESHLETCESCLELFLNCISLIETDAVAGQINADFAQHTMDFIKQSQGLDHKRPSAKRKRRRMLINYVAAAAVTIVLMSGGVFQSADDQAAQIPRENDRTAFEEKSLLFTWPSRLEASTDQWIKNMSFTKFKEVKW